MEWQRRQYIDYVADIVRWKLELDVPITTEKLCQAINDKFPGRCVPSDRSNDVSKPVSMTVSETDKENMFEIRYLPDQPDNKVAFLIACELGHLLMHVLDKNGKVKEGTKEKDFYTTEENLDADEFAAALMMPEEEFVDALIDASHTEKQGNAVITAVAKEFNVTWQAAYTRAVVLGLWK